MNRGGERRPQTFVDVTQLHEPAIDGLVRRGDEGELTRLRLNEIAHTTNLTVELGLSYFDRAHARPESIDVTANFSVASQYRIVETRIGRLQIAARSEERRVGKECRSRSSSDH